MAEITSPDELRDWLEQRDRTFSEAIAARSALRAMPAAMAVVDQTFESFDGTALLLACMRGSLVSAAAAVYPAAETKDRERLTSAALSALSAAADSALSAADSALSAADSARSAADSARSAALSAAYQDAVEDVHAIFAAQLWPDPTQVAKHLNHWEVFQKTAGPEWRWWIAWYDGFLNGRLPAWPLLRDVALIDEEIWTASPQAVADEVARIEAEHIVSSAPQVEDVFETDDGFYDVRPAIADPGALVSSVADRVKFALDTAVESNSCDLNAMHLAHKILNHALENCRDDPNALEQYLRNAKSQIEASLTSGDVTRCGEIDLLLQTLDETSLQLRADHPEVAEAAQTRLKQRLRELDAEKRLKSAELIHDLQQDTVNRLQADLRLSEDIIRDGSSVEATSEALQRSGNQAAKITLMERAKEVEGSGGMAATKILLRAQSLMQQVLEFLSGGGPPIG